MFAENHSEKSVRGSPTKEGICVVVNDNLNEEDLEEELETKVMERLEYENQLSADEYYDEVIEHLIVQYIESHGLKAVQSIPVDEAFDGDDEAVDDSEIEYDDALIEQEGIPLHLLKSGGYGRDLEQEIKQSIHSKPENSLKFKGGPCVAREKPLCQEDNVKTRSEAVHRKDQLEAKSVGVDKGKLAEVDCSKKDFQGSD